MALEKGSQPSSSNLAKDVNSLEVWAMTIVPGQFETVRADKKVDSGMGFYFEVKLLTDGLFQIGWCTDGCKTEILRDGEGIGDDAHSWAYDGFRQLKWHNGSSSSYGERWHTGDVIGCGIEFFTRTIRFWRNGRDQGEAFRLFLSQLETGHYPAASLAAKQGCVFNFGGSSLSYLPEGYTAFANASSLSPYLLAQKSPTPLPLLPKPSLPIITSPQKAPLVPQHAHKPAPPSHSSQMSSQSSLQAPAPAQRPVSQKAAPVMAPVPQILGRRKQTARIAPPSILTRCAMKPAALPAEYEKDPSDDADESDHIPSSENDRDEVSESDEVLDYTTRPHKRQRHWRRHSPPAKRVEDHSLESIYGSPDGSYYEQWGALLGNVGHVGKYAASSAVETLFPGLEVDGMGPVALPLLAHQARQLAQLSTQAPFGKGTSTVVDTTIRNTWQLSPDAVRFSNPKWPSCVAAAVRDACKQMDVNDTHVRAELYKLLLYEPGGHFAKHRDTEKARGMFATLIVALPSLYEGGELVVYHAGRTTTFDLAAQNRHETHYAAFYCNCEHEIKPIRSGYRLALVYNLIQEGRGVPLPAAPKPSADVEKGLSLLRKWPSDLPNIAFLLDHRYTPAELSFSTLHTKDREVVELLQALATDMPLNMFLAHAEVHINGGARGEHEPKRRAPIDICEQDVTLSNVIGPHDTAPPYEIKVDTNSLIPDTERMYHLLPHIQEFEPYMGNEGATVDRFYHKTCVIFWPASGPQHLQLLFANGPLAVLSEITTFLEQGAVEKASGLMSELLQRYDASFRDHTDAILSLVNRLGQFDLILAVWQKPPFIASCSPSLLSCSVVQTGDRVGWATITVVIKKLFASLTASKSIELLHALVFSDAEDEKVAADRRLLSMDILRTVIPSILAAPLTFVCAELFRLLWTFSDFRAVDSLADSLSPALTSTDGLARLKSVILPALRSLHYHSHGNAWKRAPLHRLFVKSLEALGEGIRAKDSAWAISAHLPCSCEECAPLAAFLASSTDCVLSISAAEAKRKHLSKTVAPLVCAGLLLTETDKTARPFRLVLSKQTVSAAARLEQLAAQQEKDTALLTQMRALLEES